MSPPARCTSARVRGAVPWSSEAPATCPTGTNYARQEWDPVQVASVGHRSSSRHRGRPVGRPRSSCPARVTAAVRHRLRRRRPDALTAIDEWEPQYQKTIGATRPQEPAAALASHSGTTFHLNLGVDTRRRTVGSRSSRRASASAVAGRRPATADGVILSLLVAQTRAQKVPAPEGAPDPKTEPRFTCARQRDASIAEQRRPDTCQLVS